MPSQNIRLTFYIVLTDPDQVAAYQAQYPTGVNRAPWNAAINGGAAVEFHAPWRGYTESALGEAPYTWTPWSGADETAGPYPVNVATFTRKTGGFWGIGGTTTTYWWVGQFQLAPASAPTAPPVAVYIPQRRWADGFDIPGQVCGVATSAALGFSRDASRHTEGFGLALRGSTGNVSVPITAFGLAGTHPETWDRIYARWRNAGAGPFPFIRWHATGTDAAGCCLTLMPSGQLALENIDSSGVRTLLGTFGQLTLDDWAKLDILTRFNSGAGSGSGSQANVAGNRIEELGIATGVVDGVSKISVTTSAGVTGGSNLVITAHDTSPDRRWVEVASGITVTDPVLAAQSVHVWSTSLLGDGAIRLFVNGVRVASLTITAAAGGMGASGHGLGRTEVGNPFGVAADDTEIDLDDWVSSEIPLDANGHESLTGVDFTQGSKVVVVRPNGFGPNHANWGTGDWRTLLQQALGLWTTKQVLTSTTSGAVLEVTTDYAQSVLEQPHSLGCASMQVVLQSLRGSTASGSLGYQIGAAAAVDTAITQSATMAPNVVVYRPDLQSATPADFASVVLRHLKAADTSSATVATLLAMVELVGLFGPEDVPATVDPPPTILAEAGVHNAPYPRAPWAVDAGQIAPVVIKAGTYTGNGTGQDLSFRAPVHWLFLRNTAVNQPGGIWWSSMLASHRNAHLGIEAFYAAQALDDETFVPGAGTDTQQQRYLVRIAGSDTQANANAATYEYVAISDPGGRFLLNMAGAHRGLMASYAHALANPAFTPEWAFFSFEDLTAGVGAFVGVKSSGHVSDGVTRVSGTTVANALTFGAGLLTGLTAFWNLSAPHQQVAFSLWRRHDGNNDPGEAGFFSIGSYLGDAAASRTLTVGTTGKRPLLAIIVPATASAVMRDPSHTGTISQTLHDGASNASTGITAGGIDSLAVGSALNNSGVLYHYFVVWADATAGNNGWGVNGEYMPVEADDDPTAGDDPPPAELPPVDGGGEGGGEDLPEEPDLSVACVASTQRLVNIALSRIGVSKVIADLVAENTMEAAIARLHIKPDVDAVLADFPWPFATRYASLVLVAGSESVPANVDWVYSYRAPTDMVMARRLGGQNYERRDWDPNPLAFRVGSDATGPLIYSNAAIATGVPLVLEYTARVSCPASTGSALFKDALAWRFAASLAMPLARDSQKQTQCLAMYERVLAQAEKVAANEMQQAKRGEAEWIEGRN